MNNNIIEVINLSKKFPAQGWSSLGRGHFTAVNKVNFKVRAGQIFALLGPNGAGKTTTIKMLTTLLSPTAGQIIINGFDPVKNPNEVRKSFGIVFQDQSLDDELTAKENLDFHAVLYNVPTELRKKRGTELLKFVELWERKDSLVKTFSGGMKRRLEIARGLLHHPKIFFLDEPTLGLDPQTRNHIWQYIKKLNKEEGITIFFTTHYMEEAEKVSRWVAVMDEAQIKAQGTIIDLKRLTKTKSLEDAFLALTGHGIREEEVGPIDRMRMRRKMWHR